MLCLCWRAALLGACAGCVPVIINDDVEPVLHGVVDWEQFSIRVPQARMHELPSILMQVTEEKLLRMQQALAQAWTRCVPGRCCARAPP